MLSPVAFLPILSATLSQLIPSKNLYRMILCIRTGMPFIHCSTCSLISSDWAFLSSSNFSSMRNCVSSVYVNDVPSILKCVSAYGKSFIEPFTLPVTIVCRLRFNLLISCSVSRIISHASTYCSNIFLSTPTVFSPFWYYHCNVSDNIIQ